jgi:uncharacterized protein
MNRAYLDVWREMKGIGNRVCLRRERQAPLLNRLEDPSAYPPPVKTVRHLETHISHIFLTGKFAYKIKKPVNLGFLDYSSLEQRRFFCEEELRLNRRLAPQLYREVVPISYGDTGQIIEGAAEAVEYAVKMREFPQSSRFDHMLAQAKLDTWQIDALAGRVASFHLQIPHAAISEDYGSSRVVWTNFNQVLGQLRALISKLGKHNGEVASLEAIEAWFGAEYDRLKSVLNERKRAGFIRECHGDLHLENIAWWRDAPQIFDAIEFNTHLRWGDVMSEIAFTTMDLTVRGRPDYAHRFLNRYLEVTGDYLGIQLLPLYEVYRALARAMVDCLVEEQGGGANASIEYRPGCRAYLAFAESMLMPRKRALVLMHGYSGSGKSTVAQRMLETTGAIRIRSDVERKRLHGLAANDHRARRRFLCGVYDTESTQATYRQLARLARHVLDAGFPVVVDATSLKAWQRELFRDVGQTLGVSFWLVSCRAEEAVLHERLEARSSTGGDVSDAGPEVLRLQLGCSDPLTPEELERCLVVTNGHGDLTQIIQRISDEARQ